MPVQPTRADLDFVIDLARRAGAIARERYGKVERLTKRGGAEAVTEADRECQRVIVAALAARHPDDGIIGEESDSGAGITHLRPRAGDRTWVIDPIDGTNNFVAGLGNFAVCIGLMDGGQPVLGVVYDVSRDQAFAGGRGLGAWIDDRPVRADAAALSDRSLIMMTSNCLDDRGQVPAFLERWLRDSCWKVRMLGSAALEAVQVAAGVAAGAVTINGKLWDIAAAAAIALEAGAVLTDLVGKPVFPLDTARYAGERVPFLVAGPLAHGVLLDDLRTHGR
ncbi:MAG TPA: inositol monophosphatase [Planctomycetota bacterium]|nr:inositol monophosphatase [Planctomycetota bacterium]